MTQFDDAAEVYRAIGVTPAINASGTTTAYGGTKLRREVVDIMNKAASVLGDVHELNRKVGKLIAEAIGAEAAFVCSGSAGGLVLQAAAGIAGHFVLAAVILYLHHGAEVDEEAGDID